MSGGSVRKAFARRLRGSGVWSRRVPRSLAASGMFPPRKSGFQNADSDRPKACVLEWIPLNGRRTVPISSL